MANGNKGRSAARTRKRAEWRKKVAKWERSGLSAAAFGPTIGVKPNTLAWWRRKLLRENAAKLVSDEVTLVEVVSMAGASGPVSDVAGGSWELLGPSGHILRVEGGLSAEFAELVVAVMGRSRT